MEEGPAATTRDQRRSVNRGSANSQIVAYTEGELRSNPGRARERYFVLSVAFVTSHKCLWPVSFAGELQQSGVNVEIQENRKCVGKLVNDRMAPAARVTPATRWKGSG